MLVSQQVYDFLVTFLVAGLSIGWGTVEILRLRKSIFEDLRDPIVRDRVFGSIVGLTIGVLGIIACLRHNL